MPKEKPTLTDSLRAILQSCLDSTAPMLEPPKRWLEVPLREDVLISGELHWQTRVWHRPDVNAQALAMLIYLAASRPVEIAARGNEHGQIAAGLYETYGFYVEFRVQETFH